MAKAMPWRSLNPKKKLVLPMEIAPSSTKKVPLMI